MVNVLVLVKLSNQTWGDKPPADWHMTQSTMISGLAEEFRTDAGQGLVHQIWWTLGPYDLAISATLPDDTAVFTFSVILSNRLAADTTTLIAFDNQQMDPVMTEMNIKNGPKPQP